MLIQHMKGRKVNSEKNYAERIFKISIQISILNPKIPYSIISRDVLTLYRERDAQRGVVHNNEMKDFFSHEMKLDTKLAC